MQLKCKCNWVLTSKAFCTVRSNNNWAVKANEMSSAAHIPRSVWTNWNGLLFFQKIHVFVCQCANDKQFEACLYSVVFHAPLGVPQRNEANFLMWSKAQRKTLRHWLEWGVLDVDTWPSTTWNVTLNRRNSRSTFSCALQTERKCSQRGDCCELAETFCRSLLVAVNLHAQYLACWPAEFQAAQENHTSGVEN